VISSRLFALSHIHFHCRRAPPTRVNRNESVMPLTQLPMELERSMRLPQTYAIDFERYLARRCRRQHGYGQLLQFQGTLGVF
jgi:hypothetical protein